MSLEFKYRIIKLSKHGAKHARLFPILKVNLMDGLFSYKYKFFLTWLNNKIFKFLHVIHKCVATKRYQAKYQNSNDSPLNNKSINNAIR